MTAVALLSGGLDSTVAAAQAHRDLVAAGDAGIVLALCADYGQRAARREEAAARKVARALGVPFRAVALPFIAEITRTALVDATRPLPEPPPERLDDQAGARATMRAVWVPNRNGLLIAVAAAFAEALGAARVVVGFNREEAATFADNTPEFVRRTNDALAMSTLSRVAVVAPTAALDKREIVRLGVAIGAPLLDVWSCYGGGAAHCGRCESCRRLQRALADAGMLERFEEAARARAEDGGG